MENRSLVVTYNKLILLKKINKVFAECTSYRADAPTGGRPADETFQIYHQQESGIFRSTQDGRVIIYLIKYNHVMSVWNGTGRKEQRGIDSYFDAEWDRTYT